eukprot:TRINITY_DN11441_c0_g2_i4.p1 TRINITY_DN11441_c0_g2~~TRINITY_DN11441_c0_g2_i4.p1  ORF type:complete len:437 (+),score=102.25 TRINITY_DN11441_c0_g2_i4:77-1312(+)
MEGHISYETKVQTVFEDFATNKSRTVSLDQFGAAFSRLGFSLNSATLHELHRNCDYNGDGYLDYPEWQRFAEQYPTLLECLYYRVNDYWYNIAQKEAISIFMQNLRTLREEETDARVSLHMAQNKRDDAALAVELHQQRIEDARSRCNLAAISLQGLKHDTEEARAALGQRKDDLNKRHEGEANAALLMQEAQMMASASRKRLVSQDNALALAEERLREIEAMLVEQRKVVEHHRFEVDKCHIDLSAAESSSLDRARSHSEARHAVDQAKDTVIKAEIDVSAREQAEEDARRVLATYEAQTRTEEDHLHELTLLVETAKAEERQAKETVEELNKRISTTDSDLVLCQKEESAFVSKRLSINDEEALLIDQEIKLRAARSSLESEEAKLFSDFVSYTCRVPRTGSRPVPRLK